MMKAGCKYIVSWMTRICNQVWNSADRPDDWSNGTIVCIPKIGNLTECDNWWGITLLSKPGKVYCQLILDCICSAVDGRLHKQQAGFWPNQSCIDQIFTLKWIIKCRELQCPLTVSFIYFQKDLTTSIIQYSGTFCMCKEYPTRLTMQYNSYMHDPSVVHIQQMAKAIGLTCYRNPSRMHPVITAICIGYRLDAEKNNPGMWHTID